MSELLDTLRRTRARERGQAAFYRALSGLAEEHSDVQTAERLNELLADEQHHVSRVTARIFELGGSLGEDTFARPLVESLDGWMDEARRREAEEIAWYEERIPTLEDPESRTVFAEILASERHHHEDLAGKWMPALPPSDPEESRP